MRQPRARSDVCIDDARDPRLRFRPGAGRQPRDLHGDGRCVRAVSALGAHVRDSLIANKRHEWDEFRMQVSEFELRRYLSVL